MDWTWVVAILSVFVLIFSNKKICEITGKVIGTIIYLTLIVYGIYLIWMALGSIRVIIVPR
ncbi:MAG: hypothetical protein WCV56_01230 [Candidatus Omnitrophota bacterium]